MWLKHAQRTALVVTALALALPAAADPFDAQIETPGGVDVAASPPDPLFDDLLIDDPLLDAEFDMDGGERDPWESINRVFFGVNRFFDTVLFKPATKGYQFIVPEVGRRGIRRIFLNLNSPSIIVNDLLQLRFKDAAKTTGRLLVNTVLGAGGFFDAAKEAGWEYHSSDFGQTLAVNGVNSGPYLVLPLLGPSTIRDGFGDAVDRMFQPLTYLIGFTPNLLIGGGNGLSLRDENHRALEALEESSVDFYSVMRSAYLQNRDAEIWSHTQPDSSVAVTAGPSD